MKISFCDEDILCVQSMSWHKTYSNCCGFLKKQRKCCCHSYLPSMPCKPMSFLKIFTYCGHLANCRRRCLPQLFSSLLSLSLSLTLSQLTPLSSFCLPLYQPLTRSAQFIAVLIFQFSFAFHLFRYLITPLPPKWPCFKSP